MPGVAGTWKDLTTTVNFMAGNLTSQVRNIADVTTAVAKGDCRGDHCGRARRDPRLKGTVNPRSTSSTRSPTRSSVAKEVGTEGQLGGQAKSGGGRHWEDLTDW